jgi:transposase InsO family protein
VNKVKQMGVSVAESCAALQVSKSGFYEWLDREASEKNIQDDELVKKIIIIHDESRQTYGLLRIHAQLKNNGLIFNKKKIERLMKRNGIRGLTKSKHKVKTTDSNHRLPIANRVLKTEDITTHPTKPNQVFVSDISYIHTGEGTMYLATYMDLCTRKIVGFAIDDNMCTDLLLEALNMTLGRQEIIKGECLMHSDRGSQYASQAYRERLEEFGINSSMSRRDNCYDNAFAESLFGTIKKELIYRKNYKTKEEVKKAVFEYIEVWYNKKQLHSSVGYRSPSDYESNIVDLKLVRQTGVTPKRYLW